MTYKAGENQSIMIYEKLGQTGLEVSKLCLGCMNFGSRVDSDTAFAILNQAHDLGINLIDTANSYGNSEQIIGQWLAKSGSRDDFIISSKVGWPIGDKVNCRGLSRRHIQSQIRASLDNLNTEYIDIYQPHYYNGEVSLRELTRIFADLVATGKISLIGAPIFTRAYHVLSWYYEALLQHLPNIAVRQMVHSLVSRSMDTTDLPEIAKTINLPLLGFGPIGGGLLTGKYTSEKKFPSDGKSIFKKIYDEKKTDEIMKVVSRIAHENDLENLQVALSWVWGKNITVSTILGVSHPSQLQLLVDTLEIKLTEAEMKELDEISSSFHIW